MISIDKQIEEKRKEIELLELKKKEAELNLEIKKIQNTKVEENIIVRRTIYRDEYVPNPLYNYPRINYFGSLLQQASLQQASQLNTIN